jgi:2,4-dienoyl-CoA reductase (NADPH2)
MGLNRWLGCIENPHTGREQVEYEQGTRVAADTVDVPVPGARPKRVVVAGGGPAGLQAASTAAQRGHEVILLERAEATGGQVALAATVPVRAEFSDIVRNLLAECQRYGVELRTGHPATAETIRAMGPDVLVLATGAKPSRPWWAGDNARVCDVREVLDGSAKPEGEVVVLDDLGFHQATSVAELLADRGASVRISTSGMVVGQDLGVTLDMETFVVRAHAKGICCTTDEVILGAEPTDNGRVELSVLTHTTGAMTTLRCDWVVCATHQEPDDELWHALFDAPFAVHRVGDCITPRRAHAAVIEGHRAAVSV